LKKSNIYYGNKSDSIYIFLKKGKEERFEEVEPNIIIEYNKYREPIGVEMLKIKNQICKI